MASQFQLYILSCRCSILRQMIAGDSAIVYHASPLVAGPHVSPGNQRKADIEIHDVQPNDTGTYVCEVELFMINRKGRGNGTQLLVLEAPRTQGPRFLSYWTLRYIIFGMACLLLATVLLIVNKACRKQEQLGPCSQLSIDPAQDASDWRWPRGVHGEEDSLPRSLDDDDAGPTLENPDIRVPSGTKREDGLQGRDEEEDAEEPGREENGKNTEDQEKKADDDRSNGNSVVPREAPDQGRKAKNGDTLTERHAPGGTWLTKVRSFLKDSLSLNRESYGRRGETVQEEGGERLGGNREVTRRNEERGYKRYNLIYTKIP
ncbi:hypothetical protein NDU88_000925 [Pleurodeles waltl]|uniref:Immunoglobulin V-set domain-containing protein n=1 Tax=Pleurodeles waltl TaxID=8319 RepID=A0AAV7Q8B1_PLEWA|nr:hypothetical protein NDU88_000925 [Pleurodeles waltl]